FDRLLSVRHTRPTPPSFFLLPLPPRATLFPYTTLFRSPRHAGTVPARCPGRATGGGAPTAAWPRPALAGPGTADRRLAGGRAAGCPVPRAGGGPTGRPARPAAARGGQPGLAGQRCRPSAAAAALPARQPDRVPVRRAAGRLADPRGWPALPARPGSQAEQRAVPRHALRPPLGARQRGRQAGAQPVRLHLRLLGGGPRRWRRA